MALSNLISKIKTDSDSEVNEIKAKSKSECDQIIKKRLNEAGLEAQVILEKAQRDAKSEADRIVSGAELKVRNDRLQAKQAVIEQVFTSTARRLRTIEPDVLYAYIKQAVLKSGFEGEVKLLLSEEYLDILKADFIQKLNRETIDAGSKATILVSDKVQEGSDKIILSQKGIEMNCSFKSILATLKEEMEYEITTLLF